MTVFVHRAQCRETHLVHLSCVLYRYKRVDVGSDDIAHERTRGRFKGMKTFIVLHSPRAFALCANGCFPGIRQWNVTDIQEGHKIGMQGQCQRLADMFNQLECERSAVGKAWSCCGAPCTKKSSAARPLSCPESVIKAGCVRLYPCSKGPHA